MATKHIDEDGSCSWELNDAEQFVLIQAVEARHRAFKKNFEHAFKWVAICVAVFFVTAILRGLATEDDTDASAWSKSGLALHTDHGTGCQYLRSPEGYLVPRAAPDGTHAGCREVTSE